MSLLEANSSEQVIGQAVAEFVHPLDHTRSHNRLSKTGFEWSNAPSQFRLRAVSGSLKMILASSVPMSYEGRDAILLTGMNMIEQAEMAE